VFSAIVNWITIITKETYVSEKREITQKKNLFNFQMARGWIGCYRHNGMWSGNTNLQIYIHIQFNIDHRKKLNRNFYFYCYVNAK
jgi:hypothetical protein